MPSSFLVPNCHRQLLAQITRSRTSYKLQHSCCTLGVPTLMFPFARGQVFVPWRLKGGPFKLRCRKSAKECCKTAGRLTAKFDPPWDGNGCRNCVVSGRPFRAKHGERERERARAVADMFGEGEQPDLWGTLSVKNKQPLADNVLALGTRRCKGFDSCIWSYNYGKWGTPKLTVLMIS